MLFCRKLLVPNRRCVYSERSFTYKENIVERTAINEFYSCMKIYTYCLNMTRYNSYIFYITMQYTAVRNGKFHFFLLLFLLTHFYGFIQAHLTLL